jgi:hypothetical protein
VSDSSKLPAPRMPEISRRLTEAEKRTRRMRSIALALALGALVVLFYVVTIAKIGGNVLNNTDF